MEPTTEGASGASEQPSIPVITAKGDGDLSVLGAARALMQARKPQEQQQQQQDGEKRQQVQPPAAEESTAEAGDAAAETPPGETESADQEAEKLPPIEPPRSWTKEDKELFNTLPRQTQERIAERERARDSDFSRRQQKATDESKVLEAERSKVDQARQHYESALPQLLQTLQQQQAGEFADIRTIQDVERLAREDWPRYLQWDLAQKKIAGVQQEMLAAHQRQDTERRQKFAEFAKRQDDLFLEKVPDMGDPKKAEALQRGAVATLRALGFEDAELGQAWQGVKDLSLRDHRVQLLIRDAMAWRDAQAKAKAAATKPVPPVQRPGTSQPRGAAQEQQLQNLNKQLDNTSGVNALRTAAKLVAARREASRRA